MEPDMITARRFPAARFVPTFLAAALIALLPGHAGAQMWGGERITGSGVARTETRDVGSFHAIVLGVPARLMLRQGGNESLSISGDDNIVPLVESVVEDGTLKIRWVRKGNYSTSYKSLLIVVDARSIDGLTIRGSGQIDAERLKAGDLRTTIEGSGAIALDSLEAQSVNAAIHGNGRVTAAGHADSLDLTIAGSGEVLMAKLESRRARVTLQGSGRVIVSAKENLDATIAGSGEVKYYGKPQLNQTVAGSGSIRSAIGAS
jgi:hypothetical protein